MLRPAAFQIGQPLLQPIHAYQQDHRQHEDCDDAEQNDDQEGRFHGDLLSLIRLPEPSRETLAKPKLLRVRPSGGRRRSDRGADIAPASQARPQQAVRG